MDISRRGSGKDYGSTSLVRNRSLQANGSRPYQNNVRYDHGTQKVMIELRYVEDPYGRCRHNYTYSLTLSDVATLIKVVAEGIDSQSGKNGTTPHRSRNGSNDHSNGTSMT